MAELIDFPIVFLDVDGVLSMSRCQLEDYEVGDQSLIFPCLSTGSEFIPPLERAPLKYLADIIRETNSKIVLSSTWRGIWKAIFINLKGSFVIYGSRQVTKA